MHFVLREISSREQLDRAWFHIRKKIKCTPGIDGENILAFENNLDTNIKEIQKKLKNGTYRFQKVKQVFIKKKSNSNEKRAIRIYCVKDKLVQTSIRISLEKKRQKDTFFPGIINNASIGYIPKNILGNSSGVNLAIKRIKAFYKQGNMYLISADIKSFFDVIDKERLLEIISSRIKPDSYLLALIKDCLNPKVIEIDRYSDKETSIPQTLSGVAQGSVLSPLFSNIYLMAFDKAVIDRGIPMIRYADDVAILAKSRREAKRYLEITELLLKDTSGLVFHPQGSLKGPRLWSIMVEAEYLGIKLKRLYGNNKWSISPTDKNIKNQKDKIRSSFLVTDTRNLYERIIEINNSFSSWFSVYQSAGCTKKDLSNIYSILTDVYNNSLNYLLIKKHIVDRDLTPDQLKFLVTLPTKPFKS